MSVAVRRDARMRIAEFVAEVLSPSTAKNDRILKAGFYLNVPTLRVFPIVHPDEPRIEVRRRSGLEWAFRALRPGDGMAIPERDGTLDVAAVYAGIPFDPA